MHAWVQHQPRATCHATITAHGMTEAFAWPSSFLRRHASFYHFF
jgi:hypothetical protein